jgi:hypothetical protein
LTTQFTPGQRIWLMVVQTITVAFMLILLTVVTITFTRTIIRLLASTDPALAASIVSATAVVLVAILGNYVTKYQERKAQIEAEQREKKAEVYSEFLAYWYGSMGRSKLPTGEKQELDQEYYEKIPQKLVVWGSEPFLKKYGAWLHAEAQEGTMAGFEDILFTIRSDLGYSNTDLEQGDLLRAFLKGDDEYVEERMPPSR